MRPLLFPVKWCGTSYETSANAHAFYGGSGAGSFNGKDGGTPPTFGPWTVTANPSGTTSAGSFIGDSTTLAPGNSGGNINTSGASFGLFGYNGAFVNAIRSFDAPLLIGQSFTIQLAVNFRNGNKGIDVRDASNNVIFDLNIGGNVYSVNNTGGGTTNLFGNVYDPNTVFSVQLTQTSATEGSWTITRSGGLTGTASSGIFPYQGLPAAIDLYNVQTTGGGAPEDNLFFNNLQIVPEPSTLPCSLGRRSSERCSTSVAAGKHESNADCGNKTGSATPPIEGGKRSARGIKAPPTLRSRSGKRSARPTTHLCSLSV